LKAIGDEAADCRVSAVVFIPSRSGALFESILLVNGKAHTGLLWVLRPRLMRWPGPSFPRKANQMKVTEVLKAIKRVLSGDDNVVTHDLLKEVVKLLAAQAAKPDLAALEQGFCAEYDVATMGAGLVSRPRGAGTWNSAGVTTKRIAAYLKRRTSSIALASEFTAYLAVDATEVDRNTKIDDSLNRIERR
jgi:hypothetical protein